MDSEWTIDLAPICTEQGSKSHHCANCDIREDITVIPALGHQLEKVEAKAATVEAEGNHAYWKCPACGKLFADAEGKKETTLAEVTIAKLVKPELPKDEIVADEPVKALVATGDSTQLSLWAILAPLSSDGALLFKRKRA